MSGAGERVGGRFYVLAAARPRLELDDMADQQSLDKAPHPSPLAYDDVAAAAQGLADDGLPVDLRALREALAGKQKEAGPTQVLHQHLSAWRAAQAEPAEPINVAPPAALITALGDWAQQLMDQAAAGQRDAQAKTESDLAFLLALSGEAEAELARTRATLAEREARIARLTVELRQARDIAADALVGKAKDQLAIQGKDAQLADLRAQLERQVANTAAESDARLAAEMELVGAVTARDHHAAELAAMRAQLDTFSPA
ncbi:hypothetical protein GCM10009107_35840 [Ideonella azotifigens]|uniref:KfrA N-terminal DNA-binding domain-containing protein n=3 Tax=Ideonella azotifigens TaxID=513160 RepID=A0ABN1K706_9BURK